MFTARLNEENGYECGAETKDFAKKKPCLECRAFEYFLK